MRAAEKTGSVPGKAKKGPDMGRQMDTCFGLNPVPWPILVLVLSA